MDFLSLTSGVSSLAGRIRSTSDELSRSVSRLSSGNRITRASDDVASLSIATRMTRNLSSLRSALYNLSQAGSALQVMDDTLARSGDIAERMQAISVMAASGGVGAAERGFLNQEFQQLRDEIDRLLHGAKFDGRYLFRVHQEAQSDEESLPITSLSQVAGLAAGEYTILADGQETTARVEQFDGSSWLMVGRGREGWEFDADGQGNIDDVTQGVGSSAAFAPATYTADMINGLLAQNGFDLSNIEIWLHRASDIAGTQYQDVLWRPTAGIDWTWDFDGVNYAMENEVRASNLGAAFFDIDSNTMDTWQTPGADAGNNYQRVWTFNWAGKGNIAGFSYGSTVQGIDNNDPSTFLWENTTEAHATPYTEIYIRARSPDASDTIVGGMAAAAPDDGIFTPDDLEGLSVWLDASDLDGDGIEEGNAEEGVNSGVVTWANKGTSSASDAVQNTPTSQPIYNLSGINGKASLQFDGINDYLGMSINVPETNYTQFVVFQSTDAAGTFTAVVDPVNNTAPSHDRQFALSGGQLYHRLWNTEIITSAGSYNTGSGQIASITVDGTSGQQLDANGVMVASGTKTGSDFNWQTGMVIGGHNFIGQYSGEIAEVLIFEQALSDEDRIKVEGYLAHKYNLTGNLQNSHAYKSFAPFSSLDLTVAEDAQNKTVVGTLPAVKGARYYITEGDASPFALDATTGEITVKDSSLLDYETATSYEFSVSVYIGDEQVAVVPTTIAVTNVDDSDQTISFVSGITASEQITIDAVGLNTDILFGEAALHIDTKEAAQDAFGRVQSGIDILTGRRAEVGSKQSRVNQMVQSQSDALYQLGNARAAIADTDVAATSTDYAAQLAQSQMSMLMAAQANRLHQDTILGLLQES